MTTAKTCPCRDRGSRNGRLICRDCGDDMGPAPAWVQENQPTLTEALVGIRATGAVNMGDRLAIVGILRQQAEAYENDHYLWLADELEAMRGGEYMLALLAVGQFQHAKRVLIDNPESILA